MVRRVEFCAGVFLQALFAVPGYVLERGERAVCGEDVIEVSDADDGVVRVLDDACQDAILSRTEGLIHQGPVVGAIAKHVRHRTLRPICWRGVYRRLNVAAVEVNDFSWRDVVADVHSTENRIRSRTRLSNVVNVEAGIDL